MMLKSRKIPCCMHSQRSFRIPVIVAICLSYILTVSCRQKLLNGILIITEAHGNIQHVKMVTGDSWRYIPGARIVAVNPEKPSALKILSDGFYSACSPDISSDGRHMLFAAQQKQNETWQIWEMDLVNLKSRKIASFEENCTDPVFLPGGGAVFSKSIADSTANCGYSLFTCNTDGSDLKQLTFHPHDNFATSVLKDGRLLTISRQLLPYMSSPVFMVLRPDGTKAALFYKGTGSSVLLSRGRETSDGKIMFIETDSVNPGRGDVVSISYNRPLHSRINLTAGITGSFNSVLPLKSGKLLVSYRPTESDSYALYEFDQTNKVVGRRVYGDSDFSTIEVVKVEEYNRQKKLPSEVDMGVKTGLLLCQDINFTDLPLTGKVSLFPKARKIEILGIDTTLGIVQVEDDGSFYLKVIADQPFQIRTLDENGRIVNGPCAWIWLRPNERRGCIGCHENNELAPENIVPLAIRKPPVIMPLHVSKTGDKEVELE